MHQHLSTPTQGRRTGLFGLKGNFASLRARPERIIFRKGLLFAPGANGEGAGLLSLLLAANPRLKLFRHRYSRSRAYPQQPALARPPIRKCEGDLSLMQGTQRLSFHLIILEGSVPQRFSEKAADPHQTILRGIDVLRGRVNRVPDQSIRSH